MKPSPNHSHYWAVPVEQLLSILDTSNSGLSQTQADARLNRDGKNQITQRQTLPPALKIFLSQINNWLVITLIIVSVVSFLLGDRIDSLIVIFLILSSVALGFFQEYKAESALKKLKQYLTNKTAVKRDGNWQEIDSYQLVVGDIVRLEIGDIVPADIRLITAENLATNESVLTGESKLANKQPSQLANTNLQPHQLTNTVFMGTSIAAGYGEGVVVQTGSQTVFGKTVSFMEKTAPDTEFQKQIRNFSRFLFQIILIMTIFVFAVNSWLGKGVFDSLFFAVALAIGITPELLPAIITITLSQSALKLAQKKVVVKRLIAVEDLGNIDTLCIDKTGTLTQANFSLANFVDINGNQSQTVLVKGLICTDNFIYGKAFSDTSPIDQALWQSPIAKSLTQTIKSYHFLDENEFDFSRRRTSVLVQINSQNILIVKGSPSSVLAVSRLSPEELRTVTKMVKNYESNGFQVIAVAEKVLASDRSTAEDEKDLSFLGFLLFTDPVKPDAKKSLQQLQKLQVKIKIISGDSPIITCSVAKQVGLEVSEKDIVSGEVLARLSPAQLKQYAYQYNIFARVTPEQKYQIITALNQEGHIVGFLGDGINDAPALKAADVGIAVNSGATIAKETADIILLRKDLGIMAEGIETGRKTFANIIKYILNTISANFGNMVTVAISSLFLPFIPLLPKQILLNNLISDIPLLTIATDNVDHQLTKKPKRWNIKTIGRFMLYFGLVSTIFDLLLILPMVLIWQLPAAGFRTAWFIESSLSEMLVTFTIRTRLPFYRSFPGRLLLISTVLSGTVVILISLFPVGKQLFEFSRLPSYLWGWIGVVLCSYFVVSEVVKHLFFRRYEI